MIVSKGMKTECQKVKTILWSKYGRLSEQETGRIVRTAFPGIKRSKHSSGYKYFYCNLALKFPASVDSFVEVSNSASPNCAHLIKEISVLQKQVAASNAQNSSVAQELLKTKQELEKTTSWLQYQGCQSKCRTINFQPSPPCSSATVKDFTLIPSEFLLDFALPTSSQHSKYIGSGVFGTCVLKLYRNIEVAVKYLKESSHKDLLNEAKITKELQGHPNLPILLGISPKTSTEMYIVTKFHGKNLVGITLFNALHNTFPDLDLTEHVISICQGVARGLQHMHIKGYLHNDLKTDNVVLDFIQGKPSPVIIDFGKSCMLSAGRTKMVPKGQRELYLKKHTHIAPELLDGFHTQAFSTDVYSFGCLLSSVYRNVKSCRDAKDSSVIGLLSKKCLNKIPTARPNMDTVVSELQ